jgi:hypothetical protein
MIKYQENEMRRGKWDLWGWRQMYIAFW